MIKKIVFNLIIFLSTLIQADNISGTDFVCPEIIKPVCGVKKIDNKKLKATIFKYKTFKNKCILQHSNFSLYMEGNCPKPSLIQITLPTIVIKPKD